MKAAITAGPCAAGDAAANGWRTPLPGAADSTIPMNEPPGLTLKWQMLAQSIGLDFARR